MDIYHHIYFRSVAAYDDAQVKSPMYTLVCLIMCSDQAVSVIRDCGYQAEAYDLPERRLDERELHET